MELCPTLEVFGVIMGEYYFSAIILATLEEDLSDLAHQLLGIHLSIQEMVQVQQVKCLHGIFKYFSKKDIPLAGVGRSYHFNAFCLCILARFFLVHETPCVDLGILHVVQH